MLVRRQGYAATSVDEICAAAGVSKGAFFHHFASPEELAVAAAEQSVVKPAATVEPQLGAATAEALQVLSTEEAANQSQTKSAATLAR